MVIISDARDERDRLREENQRLCTAGDGLAEMIRCLNRAINSVQSPSLNASTLVNVWRAWGGTSDVLANWDAVRGESK